MVLSFLMIAVSRRHSTRLSTRLSSFVATLLSGVLTFQLALAGGGMLCLMPSSDGISSMQAMPSASQVALHGQHRASQGNARTPVDQPCDGHGQPAQCVTTAACAPSVIPAGRAVTLTMPRVPAVVVSAPVIVPLSQTSAPELPPPRA